MSIIKYGFPKYLQTVFTKNSKKMEFLNSPINYDHIVSKISRRLSFEDMKSLSLVSKGWLVATSFFFEDNYLNVFRENAEKLAVLETSRITYRNFKINVDYSSFNQVLEFLTQWLEHVRSSLTSERRDNFMIEEIYLNQVTLNDRSFELLNQLGRLNSLRFDECSFKNINRNLDLSHTKLVIKFYCNNMKPDIFRKVVSSTLRSLTFHTRDVMQYSETLIDPNVIVNLQELVSRNTCIDNEVLETICQNNRSLKNISLSKYFKTPQIEVLSENCPNLEFIKFSDYNGINNSVMNTLTTLKEVDLKVHKEETVKWLSETEFPQVSSLQLYHGIYNFFDDNLVFKMFQNIKNLTNLYIDFGSLRSSSIFSKISKTLTNLKFLQFYGFTIYDDEVMSEEALDIQPFRSLEDLHLVASKLPESLLCRIRAPVLKDFSIFGKITNAALLNLAVNSPKIESIYASIALHVTEDGIRQIVHSLKNLKKFTLNSKDMTTQCVQIWLDESINSSD